MNIQKIIKNDFTFAFLRLLSIRKNKELLREIRDPSNLVIIKSNGECMAHSPVCSFDESNYCGLFWYLREVLEFLYYCDHMGFIPQISWSRSVYSDNNHQEKDNSFELFFEQPYRLSLDELGLHPIVSYAPGKTKMIQRLFGENDNYYAGNEEYTNALAEIARKELRFKKDIDEYINNHIKTHGIGKNVLGVHARGTDFKKKYKGHPVFVGPDDYFEYIDYAIKEFCFDSIYLATDDEQMLGDFLAHYYKTIPVIYSKNTTRGSGEKGIHLYTLESDSQSKLKNGLDALCDMSSLAGCGGLISGVSNFSVFVRIINKSKYSPFTYDKTIDKGIHKSGIVASKEFR